MKVLFLQLIMIFSTLVSAVEVPCLNNAAEALKQNIGEEFTEKELNADSLKYSLDLISRKKDGNKKIKEFTFDYSYLFKDERKRKIAYVSVLEKDCSIDRIDK